MKDLITREEAREAHSKWFESEQGSKEWDIYHQIVGGYLDQKPANPDAEVWEDIYGLIKSLDAQAGAHYAVGIGDGEWALWNMVVDKGIPSIKVASRVTPMTLSPRQLRDYLLAAVTPEPTLETEQAAHQVTREKLAVVEERLKAVEVLAARFANLTKRT